MNQSLVGGQMMRFDVQTPAVREAMRYASHNLRIGYNEKLTVKGVEDRVREIGERRLKKISKIDRSLLFHARANRVRRGDG